MKGLRLVGWFLVLIGLAILTVVFIEEILYNLNYYYNHQVNFVLLMVGGALPLAIGFVVLWEEEPEKQPSSKIKNDILSIHNKEESSFSKSGLRS